MTSIFSDEARVQVAPGLRRYELDQAIRHVRDTAGEAGSYGFMLAFQNTGHPDSLGFCHLAWINQHLAVTNGLAPSRYEPLSFACASSGDREGGDAFITQYLRDSAKTINISFADLANHLAKKISLWRFQGFADGKPNEKWADNSRAWQSLWGRLVQTGNEAVAGLPPEIADEVLRKLKRFAMEGQVVLDR